MDPRFAPLFTPLTLPRSGLRLRNRLIMAPMPTFGADAEGTPTAEEASYFARRARGVAAIVTPCCAITADGVAYPGHWRCDHPANAVGLFRVAEAIRAGGALPVMQIGHAGGVWDGPAGQKPAETLGEAQFEAALDRAASVARECGFGAIELHGSHGEFVEGLLSADPRPPAAGAMLRWLRRTSEDFSCWLRLPTNPAGIRWLRELAEAGAEAIELDAPSLSDIAASGFARQMLELAGDNTHLIGVGRVATAEDATLGRECGLPLIALGRALISEPDWVAKVRASQESGLRIAPDDMPVAPDDRAVPQALLRRFQRKRRMA